MLQQTGVHEYVATAPEPSLTITGTEGTITGVRFTYMIHCSWCRNAFHVWTDGGTIKVGLRSTGKTARWYIDRIPSGQPTVPTTCPECGHVRPCSARELERVQPAETVQAHRFLSEVYPVLRANYPELVEIADTGRYRR